MKRLVALIATVPGQPPAEALRYHAVVSFVALKQPLFRSDGERCAHVTLNEPDRAWPRELSHFPRHEAQGVFGGGVVGPTRERVLNPDGDFVFCHRRGAKVRYAEVPERSGKKLNAG